MGRALTCPLCRGADLSVEEVRFTTDIWSNMPLAAVESMLALVCRTCKHVQIVHPIEEWRPRPVARN